VQKSRLLLSGPRAGIEVFTVETESRLRILLELRHQLSQLHALGHTLPEAIDLSD